MKKYVKNVEEKDIGELWANIEKMDIQEECSKTTEAHVQFATAKKVLVEKRSDYFCPPSRDCPFDVPIIDLI